MQPLHESPPLNCHRHGHGIPPLDSCACTSSEWLAQWFADTPSSHCQDNAVQKHDDPQTSEDVVAQLSPEVHPTHVGLLQVWRDGEWPRRWAVSQVKRGRRASSRRPAAAPHTAPGCCLQRSPGLNSAAPAWKPNGLPLLTPTRKTHRYVRSVFPFSANGAAFAI